MNVSRLTAFLGALLSTLHCLATPDPEIERAEATLQSAMTQADMINAARQLSSLWNAKLRDTEAKIETKLTSAERKKFRNLQRHWKKQRTRDVKFRGDLFKHGSMQPMITNLEYSDLTRQRIEDLTGMFAEALENRTDN